MQNIMRTQTSLFIHGEESGDFTRDDTYKVYGAKNQNGKLQIYCDDGKLKILIFAPYSKDHLKAILTAVKELRFKSFQLNR